MTFMQVIEYRTNRREEVDSLFTDWLGATRGKRTVLSETHARDHDDPRHYIDIVQFPSYERAMANNDLPETTRWAERMRELCDEGPTYINLDVVRETR
jgi:quinol monooxygenase YgiN